ncbi:TAXI family TRAP transporter solute-binding subunit [Marinobacterium lutimaris]|nr:TAXI family TRAP transporter solute-binding subunit [Marinobacterium lutimaris]
MMIKTIKHWLIVLAAVSTLAIASQARAESYNMTVAGASPGGLWSLLGAGIDASVKKAYPGSTITYQTSGGGIANVGVLDRDQADMALIHDAEMLLAESGSAPFREPITSLSVLSYMYTWAPMQALMRNSFAEEYGIESFEDIAEVKPPIVVAINRRGNIASSVAEEMFKAIGVTADDIKSWGGELIYAASDEQMSLIQDRRADMILNSLFVRHSSIMQAGNSVELTLLPLAQSTIDTVNTNSGTIAFTIPAETYEWSPAEVNTVSLGAALAVRADMDEQTAYNLTKALFENYQTLAGVHPAMAALTPEVMASVEAVPYHKGALRYLTEAGLK